MFIRSILNFNFLGEEMILILRSIVAAVLILVMFFITGSTNFTLAASSTDNTSLQYNTPEDPIYGASDGIYKDQKVYYSLDIVSPSSIQEKGFIDKFWDTVTLKSVEDKFADAFHYSIFSGALMQFNINLLLTNTMIGILNFAYDTNIINSLIDSVQNVIVSMAGITENAFGSTGLYGGFLGIIAVVIAVYTLYQFIVKKASITAFSGLLKSLVSLTIALLFFSNFGAIIKGANTISVETTGLMLSGNANMAVSSNGNVSSTTIKDKMNDNIFNIFVHKPYLMLQYGTTDQSKIGDERVLNLLSKKIGTTERENVALQEVTEKGNDILTYPSALKRLIFINIVWFTNGMSSIPIYLLSGSLIIFQFWFLIMAMIAPFALLWSSLPNQFGVLKRYFLELSVPLVLKMAVSILALVVFGLNEVIYSIGELSNGTTLGYILSVIVQGLILLTLFLLRKRIFSIFSMGSELLNNVRNEMNNTFVNPFKKSVQGLTTAGGAIVGGVMAGPQGVIIGANMGSSIGNLATGEKEVTDFAKDTAITMLMAERLSKSKINNPNLNENNDSTKNTNVDIPKGDNSSLTAASDGFNLAYYLQDKGLTPEMVDKTFTALEKQGLNDITRDEMNNQYKQILDDTESGNLKGDFASNFANGIAQDRRQRELEKEQQILLDGANRPVETPIPSTGVVRRPIAGSSLPSTGNVGTPIGSASTPSTENMDGHQHKLQTLQTPPLGSLDVNSNDNPKKFVLEPNESGNQQDMNLKKLANKE